ncbi:transposase [Gimesia sp.]|uniref:transposase n=1 Tax=Gimesia sp. TaxID=2024833 RepID=UPI003A8EECC7
MHAQQQQDQHIIYSLHEPEVKCISKGNAQVIVEENQIILSAEVTNQVNDMEQVEPVLEQMESNLAAAEVEEKPQRFPADACYYSDSNVEFVQAHDLEPLIATGKFKRGESVPESPPGRIPHHLSAKERMGRKLRTQKGRAMYSRRKGQVEPVFGQIKACQKFRQFLLRGLGEMQGERTLASLTHYLLKLLRFQTA